MFYANNRDGSASRSARGRCSVHSFRSASHNASSARQPGPYTDPSTGEQLPVSIQGWDASTHLVAKFMPNSHSGLEFLFASFQWTDHKSAKNASKSASQVKKRAKKRAKQLWRSYAPRLLTSFKYDRATQNASTHDKSEAEVVAQTASQLQLSASFAVYQEPPVPLTIETLDRQVVVKKHPLSTVLQAAARVGIDPTKTSEKAMSSVSSSSGSANEDKAKQSGAIAKVDSDPPCDITFVGLRDSLRKLLSSEDMEWRIDLIRIGQAIFLRPYLSCFEESLTDEGHLFHYACTKGNEIGSCVVGHELSQVQDGSALNDYRALIQSKVGDYNLLTSCEIDLATCEEPTECSQFREIKCIIPSTLANEDHAESIWLLCMLAGIETLVCGIKEQAHYSQEHIPRIDEIREVSVDSLISDQRKEAYMKRFQELLAFMHRNVQEGKSYKLVNECVFGRWRIALHEISRDTEEEVNEAPAESTVSARLKRKMQQVMSPTLIAEIQQWAAEEREKDRIKEQQQRQEAERKKQEEQRPAQQKALELEQKQKQAASAAAAKATASDSASASAATRAAPDERASAPSAAAAAAASASSAAAVTASAEPRSGQQSSQSIDAKIASKSETRRSVAGDETAAPSAAASASSSRDERDRLLQLVERHMVIAEHHTAITMRFMDELAAIRC